MLVLILSIFIVKLVKENIQVIDKYHKVELRAKCKTNVTHNIKWNSYNSFAPIPQNGVTGLKHCKM